MNFKKLFWLALPVVAFILFATGCLTPGAQFGAPGRTGIKGVVVMPDNNCYTYTCENPQVSEGEPAALADIELRKEDGTVYKTAKADACGKYEITDLEDSCYILYAKIQNGEAQVKKGIYPLTTGTMNDVGEANVYTTAQVIIYEVAKELYPDLVKCSDIPNFVPTPALLNAVENVLKECKDAQKDCNVLNLARGIATSYFGAPGGGGGGAAGGGGGGGTPGGDTTPAASTTTITASKTATFTSNSVSGEITVNNTGTVATTGLAIQDQLQKWDGEKWVDVGSPATITVTSQIPAGGNATFLYSLTGLTFEPGVKYRNKAVVSITNGNSVTVYSPEEGTVPALTGTVTGKICQHNGHGYGQAWVHFRDANGNTYSAEGDQNGQYTIQLPPGGYVMWADKPTGGQCGKPTGGQCGQCPTSIGYDPLDSDNNHLNPAQSPNGYICLTVEAGKTHSYDIWIDNSGPKEDSCPLPPLGACSP